MMIEKLINHKKIVLIIELAILSILFIVMIMRLHQNNIMTIDLNTMSTDYDDAMSFNGTSWNFDSEYEKTYWGYDYLLYGPKINLKKGTYTIVIDYIATESQKVILETQNVAVEASDIFLSKNKNQVRYDFRLPSSVDDFQMRVYDFYGGEFSVNGITIIRNTHDIRVTIFVWILLSIIVDLLLYNKSIKDRFGTVSALVGIAFLASIPLFAKGIMDGHDIRFHFARIEAIADGLKNGYFPVKMYSVFNDGYGYPVGIFYGDALLYIPSIMRIVGFTITQSYKVYIVLINLLTSFSSYLCGIGIFKKKKTAVIISLAFTTSTYRLLCIYTRAALGEFSATCFYPIVILAIWNIYTQDCKKIEYRRNAVLLAAGMAGLVYNHVLSTEMVVIVLFVLAFSLYRKTFRKETVLVLIRAVFICALFSAAFIVPFLEYYVRVNTSLDTDVYQSAYIQKYGAYLSDYFSFFKSITGYANLDVSSRMQITPGLLLLLGLAVALYLIITKKSDKIIALFTLSSIICLFVGSNVCPWDLIYEVPVIGQFLVSVQFPYRYIGIAVCFLTILLGMVIEKIAELGIMDEKQYTYTIVISLLMTFVFVSAFETESELLYTYDTADISTYTHHNPWGLGAGEYLLEDTDMSNAVLDYAVYGENINALIQSETGLKMVVWVDAGENATLQVPRFAYLHFKAENAEGDELATTIGSNNKVVVQFSKPYKGDIYIDFVEPWYWRMAELISVISVLGVCIYIIRERT